MEDRDLEIEPICTLPKSLGGVSQNENDTDREANKSHSFGTGEPGAQLHVDEHSLNVHHSDQPGDSQGMEFPGFNQSPPISLIQGLVSGPSTMGNISKGVAQTDMVPKRKNSEEYFGFLEVDSYKFGFGGSEWGIVKNLEDKPTDSKSTVKSRKEQIIKVLEKYLIAIDKRLKTAEVLILKNNLQLSSVRNKIKTAFEDLHIIEKESKYLAERSPHNSQIDIKESLKEFISDNSIAPSPKKVEDIEAQQTVQDLLQLYGEDSPKFTDSNAPKLMPKIYSSDLYDSRDEQNRSNTNEKYGSQEEIKIVVNAANSEPQEDVSHDEDFQLRRAEDATLKITEDLSGMYAQHMNGFNTGQSGDWRASQIGRSRMLPSKLQATLGEISAARQAELASRRNEQAEVYRVQRHLEQLCATILAPEPGPQPHEYQSSASPIKEPTTAQIPNEEISSSDQKQHLTPPEQTQQQYKILQQTLVPVARPPAAVSKERSAAKISACEQTFGLRSTHVRMQQPARPKPRQQATCKKSPSPQKKSPKRQSATDRSTSPGMISTFSRSARKSPDIQPLFTRDNSQSRISLTSSISGRSMKKMVEDLTCTLKSRPFEGRKLHSFKRRNNETPQKFPEPETPN